MGFLEEAIDFTVTHQYCYQSVSAERPEMFKPDI